MNRDFPIMLKTAVPLFFGFSDGDIRAVIQVCTRHGFREGEVLFESGSPSTEMLLILSGALLVRTNTGAPLAHLFCPETVGEMGYSQANPARPPLKVSKMAL